MAKKITMQNDNVFNALRGRVAFIGPFCSTGNAIELPENLENYYSCPSQGRYSGNREEVYFLLLEK